MVYGFSYMGALFVLFIMAPSFRFVNLPAYPEFHSCHKWAFAALDRVGLTFSILMALIFRNSDYHGLLPDLILLALAWGFLIGFQVHWILCCRRSCRPMVVRRFPLMLLPALALFFLGLYGRNWYLSLGALLYGLGHGFGWTKSAQIPCSCPCCEEGSCDIQK